MIELSLTQIITGILIALFINILAWVFAWGKTVGKLNQKQNDLEEKVEGDICQIKDKVNKDMLHVQEQLTAVHITIIPECQKTFTELKTGQALITGQVTTILSIVQEIRNGKAK